MHEIFINYRTSGGKDTAYSFKDALGDRFGEESVFLAGESIDAGANYVDALVDAVRRSHVLLALIHGDWLDAPDPRRPGRRALTNPGDWVRRELEVAFDSGVLVVPVFLGRRLEQLDARRLPRSLAQLAECQYVRFGQRTRVSDLAQIGDRLVRQVPALAALDRRPPGEAAPDNTPAPGQSGGIGSVQGGVGTFVQNAHGPLNTGPGSQINGTQVNGDGTFVGGSQSGFTLNFGSRPRQQDGER